MIAPWGPIGFGAVSAISGRFGQPVRDNDTHNNAIVEPTHARRACFISRSSLSILPMIFGLVRDNWPLSRYGLYFVAWQVPFHVDYGDQSAR